MPRKNRKELADSIGRDEHGLLAFPTKMGNVRIARLLHGRTRGCAHCFPHGIETTNCRLDKRQRSWKSYRATPYRPRAGTLVDRRGVNPISASGAAGA